VSVRVSTPWSRALSVTRSVSPGSSASSAGSIWIAATAPKPARISLTSSWSSSGTSAAWISDSSASPRATSPSRSMMSRLACAAAAALAAGARVPDRAAMGDGEQGRVGAAFMQANAGHYHRVFLAGRLVVVGLSALLALVVWRWARRLWGVRGALVALAFYAFAPEALAHAGVVTMDVPTALGDVCCWGKTGRIADAPLLPLVTQSGLGDRQEEASLGPLFTFNLECHHPCQQCRGIKLTDHRLDVGEASRDWVERR